MRMRWKSGAHNTCNILTLIFGAMFGTQLCIYIYMIYIKACMKSVLAVVYSSTKGFSLCFIAYI